MSIMIYNHRLSFVFIIRKQKGVGRAWRLLTKTNRLETPHALVQEPSEQSALAVLVPAGSKPWAMGLAWLTVRDLSPVSMSRVRFRVGTGRLGRLNSPNFMILYLLYWKQSIGTSQWEANTFPNAGSVNDIRDSATMGVVSGDTNLFG